MTSHPQRQAIVTGGAGDIGGAISSTLSAAGYVTTILDMLDDDAGQKRAAELAREAPVHYRRADTTSPLDIESVLTDMPRVDLAVLCAGTVKAQPFLDIDIDDWHRQLEINLTGAFVAAQAAARRMVTDQIAGQLLFISSWVASRPWPEITAYSASKAGMDQLMRQAALELAPHGIRANAVAPGIVMAGLAKVQFETEPQYAARASASIPLGSPQTAQQIADAVGFLASPAAASMTGSVLLIDGGCTLGTTS